MSKLRVIFGLFVAVLLLAQPVRAAVVEVEVTIKSVDVKVRTITVSYDLKDEPKTIDLDVSRKAEITVNGKKGALDAVGPGQKAKVSYDKDLAVVTKIDASGEDTASLKEVVRFILSVSEFGDCILEVEQTSTPISAATQFDGKAVTLARLPKSDVQKREDGSLRIIHSFDRPDELSSVFSTIHNAELDRSTGTIMFVHRKGELKSVTYWSDTQFPAIVCYDRLSIREDSGIAVELSVGTPPMGTLIVNCGRASDEKNHTTVNWLEEKDGKTKHTKLLDTTPFDIREGCKRRFRLPLPNVRIEDRSSIRLWAWCNEGATVGSLSHLLIQGRLHPVLGIGFGEQAATVFAEAVVPGSLADKAGLKAGDVFMSINGQQPQSKMDAMSLCGKVSIGDQVQIKIRRGDVEHELNVVAE